MALWDKLTKRGNVEDRRDQHVSLGGISVIGIAILLGINFLIGGDINSGISLVTDVIKETSKEVEMPNPQFTGTDPYQEFTEKVLGSLNEYWTESTSTISSWRYEEPRLVLFRGQTASYCQSAKTDTGPHYCPSDKTVYIDETFFKTMEQLLDAQMSDVAQAYVIAHEVGHHVQNVQGKLSGLGSNQEQIAIELQADCYAGLWMQSMNELGIVSTEEMKKVVEAVRAVGDDAIQSKTQGRINENEWTHGSSEERARAFTNGYEGTSLVSCIE